MSLAWKTEGMNYFHLLLPQHLAPLWERLTLTLSPLEPEFPRT